MKSRAGTRKSSTFARHLKITIVLLDVMGGVAFHQPFSVEGTEGSALVTTGGIWKLIWLKSSVGEGLE